MDVRRNCTTAARRQHKVFEGSFSVAMKRKSLDFVSLMYTVTPQILMFDKGSSMNPALQDE